jgi:quercetin dioxygenase-like cupin family protein
MVVLGDWRLTMKFTHLSAVAAAMALTAAASAQSSAETPLAKKASDSGLAWGPCPPIFSGECAITVLHGDPSKPNADVFLRVGAGNELPLHRHSSAERMILVGGQLKVEYVGSKPSTLDAGDYAFGPAGLAHKASCISKTPCTLFITFEGAVDALPANAD